MIHVISNFNEWFETVQNPAGVDISTDLLDMRNTIRAHGINAIIDYTKRYDYATIDSIFVGHEEITASYAAVASATIDALTRASVRIRAYHQNQLPEDWEKSLISGIQWGQRYSPIGRVGLYVPGGRAAYPSTVLMNAIPAQLAGVSDIVIATPPRPDGSICPEILVAADICGISQILRVGGAQAVFLLADGIDGFIPVDKIVGPGNRYVTVAKQMVYGKVDIDKPAGPSEVAIWIDTAAFASYAAAEMLAQMEHDPDAIALTIASSQSILDTVLVEFNKQISLCSRKKIIEESTGVLCVAPSIDDGITWLNQFAAEHLVILSNNSRAYLPRIRHAGAIFLGPHTPVAAGDYGAGPNHVLPTGQAARFSSPLGVIDFMKYTSVLELSASGLESVAQDIIQLANTEQLDAHSRSVSIRIDSNRDFRV